jgi:hypothetical protein
MSARLYSWRLTCGIGVSCFILGVVIAPLCGKSWHDAVVNNLTNLIAFACIHLAHQALGGKFT